jgi:hypothetical protein
MPDWYLPRIHQKSRPRSGFDNADIGPSLSHVSLYHMKLLSRTYLYDFVCDVFTHLVTSQVDPALRKTERQTGHGEKKTALHIEMSVYAPLPPTRHRKERERETMSPVELLCGTSVWNFCVELLAVISEGECWCVFLLCLLLTVCSHGVRRIHCCAKRSRRLKSCIEPTMAVDQEFEDELARLAWEVTLAVPPPPPPTGVLT